LSGKFFNMCRHQYFCSGLMTILCIIGIYGCSGTPDKLKTAERLMQTAPDSSYHILQHIKPKHLYTRSDKALYALLMSQALDKNDIKVESDSLIRIATDYYTGKDPEHAGYAWFYMARCAGNSGNAKIQAEALLKTQEYARMTTNYKLQGLMYAAKGDMYKSQKQTDSSIYYNKCAYRLFRRIGDHRNGILSLLSIGRDYLYDENYDSSLFYFQLSEKIAKNSNDTLIFSAIYRYFGNVYLKMNEYKKAIYYYHFVPLTHIAIYDSNKWFLLANVFVKTGKNDSAIFYLKKITELGEMAPGYFKLWQILYEKEGKSKDALYFSKRVVDATDSLYKKKLDVSFAGMEKKYKYKNLQLENKNLIIKDENTNILLLIALFCLSVIVIISLLWRNRIKNHQLKIQVELAQNEKIFLEKEKENIKLLEQQLRMQNILLSNVKQYRDLSIKRVNHPDQKQGSISPILNLTFHEELIASMDIQYHDISKRLTIQFPDLTERDILICCFLLADFETGMIATILDVKIESITKHRYRLRTKLGLQNSENLLEYLRSF
jgi:hypothetical protein